MFWEKVLQERFGRQNLLPGPGRAPANQNFKESYYYINYIFLNFKESSYYINYFLKFQRIFLLYELYYYYITYFIIILIIVLLF